MTNKLVFLAGIIVSLGVAFTVLLWGPDLEQHFWPMVTDASIYDIARDGREVSFRISAIKTRDCVITSSRAYVSHDTADLLPITVVNETNAPIGTLNRPLGRYNSGPFRLMTPALGFDGEFYLYFVSTWNCHAVWQTTGVVGPLKVVALLQSPAPL